MRKLYCQSCGSGTAYSLEKPNFCGKCGISFSSVTAKQQAASRNVGEPGVSGPTGKGRLRQSVRAQTVDPNEESYTDDDVREVPHIDRLEIDIEIPNISKGTKIENLMGTSTEGAEGLAGHIPYPQDGASEKQVLDDLRREGGTLRESG